ncbi:hypothetical protein DB42_AZ00440 [Neochlamydia sp. EPS4]|uniref:endonuclease/exonuclease/phosphatase family protein n=1 Tax=Neochlamydia sp. EPS4 TaxID=1478175 RepID=UPI000582BACC|nr:endonuclease/exonuclease/phosphatase family protein [Neochlamydia sp. EPS4]KIC74689.1 hypothetical protein DB42_AZ00440 [Neochlamydia sp. EPS4]
MNPPITNNSPSKNHVNSTSFDKQGTEERKEEVKNLSIKIMSYNVCNSDKVAKDSSLCWESRKGRIFKLILEESPDIICFQEIRNADNICVMADLWNNLGNKEYDIISFRNNPTPASFINVIAYKMSVLSLDKVFRWWPSEKTPYQLSDDWGDGWGRVTLMAKFYPLTYQEVKNKKVMWPNFNKEPLYVVNLHNCLELEKRCQANKNTVERIKQEVKGGKKEEEIKGHVFVCGDYNNFPDNKDDNGHGGSDELKYFTDQGYEEVSSELYLKTTEEAVEKKVRVSGTFIGFSNDPYPPPEPNTFGAQLDHILYKHFPTPLVNKINFDYYVNPKKYFEDRENEVSSEKEALYDHHTGESLRDKFPSDHLPLVAVANNIW